MSNLSTLEPIDYLIIGHITQDVTPQGFNLGGTASYSSLTARSFGLRVGIVTACAADLVPKELKGMAFSRKASEHTSTFQNIYTPAGRIQHILHVADSITLDDVPSAWLNTPIVHLGPLAGEIPPSMARAFPNSLTGVTPQGWMRAWNGENIVSYRPWQEAAEVLPHVQVCIMSIEDVCGDEDAVGHFASLVPILVVTEGMTGSRVYWHGDVRNFHAPSKEEVDPVGAGDIFAASFFIKYYQTKDPWEAARFATLVGANSVTRAGIQGVPTAEEINTFTSEIIGYPAK